MSIILMGMINEINSERNKILFLNVDLLSYTVLSILAPSLFENLIIIKNIGMEKIARDKPM